MSYYLPPKKCCNPCQCQNFQIPFCCQPYTPCPCPSAAKGPTGATGPSGSSDKIYGGLYNSIPRQIIAQDAPDDVQLNTDTPMPLSGITQEGNSLKINKSGVYQVFYSVNGNSKQNGVMQTFVRKNNTTDFPYSVINTQFLENSLSGSDTPISFAVDTQNSFIAELNSGDTLQLIVFFPNLSLYPNLVVNIYRYGAVLYAIKLD